LRDKLGQSAPLLDGLLYLLRGCEAARYWGCMCISAIVHKHERNQTAVANHQGVIAAILLVLDREENCASRGAACCTLVELTFRNAGNALLIATSPGMMRGVLTVLQSSFGDVRDDAAGVLRNCSNYSQEAAMALVETPRVLDTLIDMCSGHDTSSSSSSSSAEGGTDSFLAVAVIQNLSRCDAIVPILRKTRVREQALERALRMAGTGEQHDVMRAEALMALTNLATAEELSTLAAPREIVEMIVQMLRCAVRDKGHSVTK